MAKIYLAAPWFKPYELTLYQKVLEKLRKEGHEVYAPKESQIPNAWDMSNAEWGKKVFEEDIKAIQECDEVWVLNYGLYSDTGTAWECGYAYGIGKPIHQLVLDLYGDCADSVFSLMMVNGCTNYQYLHDWRHDKKDDFFILQK